MDYEKTEPFSGNMEKVLEVARNAFIQNNFQIVHDSETEVEFTGPGMLSSRQNPIVGISRIRIRGTSGNLSIEAEFGGIRQLTKYLALFIVGMAIFFLVLLGILLPKQGQPLNKTILISLGPFVPWPVLIPLIHIWMRSRTSKVLERLFTNMITLGREG
ncbi:MAG: hypothetical protein JSW23_05345 [Planctomycetota bacterium]|nr:MAG: hypothetical protein JSW23_05345 [Planctomycetota bacterium]